MKNCFILFLLAILMVSNSNLAFPQAKKPSIMILPSDVWCNINGYMIEFDNQGTREKVPDYKMAFQENSDLILVISKINGMMADRGFPLKNAESELKSLATESAEESMLMSKNGGTINESPVDKLKKIAKADIIMQLTWTINNQGPKKSITFNLQGIDSYTDKQIATAAGTGAPSFSAVVPLLLEEAVLSHLDNFNSSLQTHFDDLFTNGREITLRIKKFNTWDKDLETDFDGKELNVYIEEWLSQHTINGRFSTTDATENMMLFEQVRIPLFDGNGRAIDARGFCRDLQNYLKNPPFGIINKLVIKGLGQATLVLGDK